MIYTSIPSTKFSIKSNEVSPRRDHGVPCATQPYPSRLGPPGHGHGPTVGISTIGKGSVGKMLDILTYRIGHHILMFDIPRNIQQRLLLSSYFCGTWPIEIDYLWWSTYSTWWMFQKAILYDQRVHMYHRTLLFSSEIDPHNMDVPQNKMPENHQLL